MPAERTCPRCGSALSSEAFEGLCPTCVGRAAFATACPDPAASKSEREVFAAAAALTLAERRAYLDGAGGGNAESRARVEEWLRKHDADSFMKTEACAPEIEANLARLKPEEVGERIGNYKLMEQIGEGGFGTVWVADQEKPVRRRVALKIIKLGMDTKEVIARFEQERQALAMMDHPHIAKVFDAGATQWGRPFFVMELVRGIKITDYCDQANLPVDERLRLFVAVCRAVQHAHQKGIIHRDLKPSNILVTLHDGVPVPKVIDFGVAKAIQQQRLTDLTIYTQFEQMIGTPLYMSPEQAEMSGLDIDTRSDIYSLGVLLYELLTGRTPFDPDELMRKGRDEIRRAIREQEPRKPSTAFSTMPAETRRTVTQHRQSDGAKLIGLIRGDLDWIVMRALENDRTRRYETANGLAMDIERHLASEPVRARPPSGLYRFRKLVHRNRAAFAAGAAVAVALLAGVAGIVFQWHRAETAGRATRERLAHEHVRAGLRLAEDGDALRGLPHFVEALRLGLGSASREHVARLRFEVTMRQAPQLARLWLRERDGEAQFAEEAGRILIIDGMEARVWDAASGVAVSPPLRHSDMLRHVWIDPQASRVITEKHDDHITIWEPGTAHVLAEMSGRGHLRAVLGGPRLRLPIWVQKGRTVRCISALDGAVDATFDHPEPVSWAVAAPDGMRVLVAAGQRLFLWDVASGALVVPPVDFGGEPDFGTFDPSGHVAGLRVKYESSLALFDLTTGTIAARGTTRSLGSIRHGWLDGTRWVVLSRKFSGSALRDPVTDHLLFDAQSGAGTVTSDFATQRNVFALAGENGASQVWDADAAQAITPRLWAAGRPSSAILSADATRLFISSSEPAVRLWKMQAHGGPAWTALDPAPVVAAWWNADGSQLRTVGADGRLTCRDVATGRLALDSMALDSMALDEVAIAVVPDGTGRLAFVGGPHGARLWDTESGKPAGPLIPCPEPIRDIALSANGRHAAIVTGEKTLLCDPTAGATQHTLIHPGTLRCLLGVDGTRLATITRDTVQIWNADTGQKVGEPIAAVGSRHGAGARFDATGGRLAVWWAAPEIPGGVRIVATDTGHDLLPPIEHPSVVIDAEFSPTGDLLICASGDQRLWLWRTRDGLPALAPILQAGAINAVGFSPDGLLFWSRTGRLFSTWETATGDAAAPVLKHVGPRPAEPGRKASGGVVTHDDEKVRVSWSTDHRVSTCDGSGGVDVWDFHAGSRPIEEMESLARVLSMHRIEPGGGLVPLAREELRAAWAAVHRE